MNRIPNEQREHIVREAIAQRDAVLAGTPRKLWLWKNFVDGRPEYWAFDNPYPTNLTNGDPQTLGQPCGYAIFKPSRDGSHGRTEEQVLREMASVSRAASPERVALPEQPSGDEWLKEHERLLDEYVSEVRAVEASAAGFDRIGARSHREQADECRAALLAHARLRAAAGGEAVATELLEAVAHRMQEHERVANDAANAGALRRRAQGRYGEAKAIYEILRSRA